MPGRSPRRVAVVAAVAVVAFLHLTPFLMSSEAVDFGESPDARLEKLEAAYDSLAERALLVRAEPIATEILTIVRSQPDPSLARMADASIRLAKVRIYQERLEEADSLLTRCFNLLDHRYGDEGALETTPALEALALLRMYQGRLPEAHELITRALELRERHQGPNHLDVAWTRVKYVEVLGSAGEWQDAVTVAQRAVETYERATLTRSDSLRLAVAFPGGGLAALGRYAEAERVLYRAHAIQVSILGIESEPVAATLRGLAYARQQQGDPAGAVQFQQECLDIRRSLFGMEHRLTRQAANNVAVALNAMERYEEAEAILREVIVGVEAALGPDAPRNSLFYLNLCYSLRNQKRYTEAQECLEHIVAKRRRYGDDDPILNQAFVRMGVIAFELGEYARAESLYTHALIHLEKINGRYNSGIALSLIRLARAEAASGDLESAVVHTLEAVEIYEWLRLREHEGSRRATFMQSPYEQLAALYLELGRDAEAWTAVVHLSGLSLAELLRTSGLRRLTQDELAREKGLAAELADAEAALAAVRRNAAADTGEGSEDEVGKVRTRLIEAEAAWTEFQVVLAARYPKTEGREVTVPDLQAALDERTALVGWVDHRISQDRYVSWAYLVRHRGPVVWTRIAGVDDETDRGSSPPAEAFRELIISQAPMAAMLADEDRQVLSLAANRVWRQRCAPLEPYLEGIDNVTVVSSRAMNGIPLAAVMDDSGDYWGDRFNISHTPSLTLIADSRNASVSPASRRNALLLGDPPFRPEHLDTPANLDKKGPDFEDVSLLRNALSGDPESLARLPRLPWSRAEVESVAARFPSTLILLGSDASESVLSNLADDGTLAEFDVLHFATHALIDEAQPQRSALALSQVDGAARPGLEGLITAGEIMREWRLEADLVTLSACRTAMGRETHEGTLGLATAFLEAGAGGLLVSLWNVDDEATSMLMQQFYSVWLSDPSLSQAGALREARQWLRAQESRSGASYDHPFFWASFVTVGYPR